MLSQTFKSKKTIIFLGLKMKKHIACNDIYLINHLRGKGSLNPMLKTEDYLLNCEDNDYIVGRKLGSGGFNKVYELKDIYNNVIKDKVIRITSKAYSQFNDDNLNDELIDENTLTFVALHEVSHIATKSIGHKTEFWDNFKFILEKAKEAGIHDPVDYKKSPQEYCGTKIHDNPYYDS